MDYVVQNTLKVRECQGYSTLDNVYLFWYITSMPNEKRIIMYFYKTPVGNEPVREWLKSMSREDREIIGKDLLKIELGFPIGMPLCRSLGNGLWECRSDLSQNRIARVIFCVSANRLVALHGFIKKTQKTPPSEIDLALKRKKESEL